MKVSYIPYSTISISSPWFWAIPVFALIAMLLIGLTGTNQPLFLYLNQALYIPVESIWINITLYGDAAMVMILMLPLAAKRPDIVVKSFIAALISAFFLHAFKEFLSVPRPPAIFPAELFHQLGHQFSASSFPSGHAAAPFVLATMIIFLVTDMRIRSAVIIYASIIALSRIATGVHWPIDILGGMFFGWFSAFLSMKLFPTSGNNLIAQRIVTVILLLAVIHLVFLHDGGDKEARILEVLTPIICLILSLKGLKSLFLEPILTRVKK